MTQKSRRVFLPLTIEEPSLCGCVLGLVSSGVVEVLLNPSTGCKEPHAGKSRSVLAGQLIGFSRLRLDCADGGTHPCFKQIRSCVTEAHGFCPCRFA